jgi:3-hydroxyisobutyrate dehydrogenase-like beta-hydroxyacid dehydrogenase
MGAPMVERLLAARHSVTGYNRTRSKAEPFIAAGMQWADTPRAVAQAADITISMVTNDAALEAITGGPDGILAGLGPGKIYVDMGTISPGLAARLAEQARATGADMLQAPVSGSVPAIKSGNLIIIAGGNAETLEKVRPVFEHLSQKIIHIGDNAQAVAMKIAINLNLVPQLMTLFESLLLAERSGIPREQALDALLNSVAASGHMKYRAPLILNLPREVWFSIAMIQKDTQLALALGRELNVPLPNTAQAAETLTAATALGYGEEDFAAVFKVAEALAGFKHD